MKQGFTLIEVLLALAIFMLVITPLFELTGRLVTRAADRARAAERVLVAESFLLEQRILSRYGKKSPNSQKIAQSKATVTYQTSPLSGDLKAFKGVMKEQVVIEWLHKGKKRTERIISFIPEQVLA